MNYIHWIIEFFATFTELFFCLTFCDTFLEKATSYKNLKTIIISVFSLLIISINRIELYSPITAIICLILVICSEFVLHRKCSIKIIAFSSIFLLIIIIIDNIVVSTMSYAFKIPVSEINQQMSLNRIFAIIFSKTLLALVTTAISKFWNHKQKLKRKQLILLSFIATLFLALILTLVFAELRNKTIDSAITILFFLMLLILLFILLEGIFKMTDYYEKKELLNLALLRNRFLTESVKETEQTLQAWKTSIHDFKHIIMDLKTLAANNDLDGINHYLSQESDSFNKQLFYYKTGNDTVDTVIYVKQKLAEEMHITFTVNASIPENCPIASTDFASILGNLLDNALEASNDITDPYIELKISQKGFYLIIVVSNKCNNTNLSLETTKPNTSFHGIGLYSVKLAVKNYNGQVSIKQDADIFSVYIMIPLDN